MIMTYISDDAEYIIGKEFEVDTIIRSNGRNIEGTIVATVTDLEDGEYDLLEYTSLEKFLNDWEPVRDGCGHVTTKKKKKENILKFPRKDDQ